MEDLSGQIALVTGAGRPAGMGRAIALRLAEEGADLIVADIARKSDRLNLTGVGLGDNPEELEETARLVRDLGRRCVAVPMDVTDPETIALGLEKATKDLGEVTILVNNAGTGVGVGPFDSVTNEQWLLSFQVNVLGVVNMIRAVLPGMRTRGQGSIINIASTFGLAATAEYGAYIASKHAVVGLTRLLSQELAPAGIRVNAVAPGYIETDMGKAEQQKIADAMSISVEEAGAAIVQQIPVGRMGQPSDVARSIAWLANPASSFVNGAIVPVHGGQVPGFA
jgi:NAD(P)-dependent dehydrogenase (short-subunit alcohol dehydrogenase family)